MRSSSVICLSLIIIFFSVTAQPVRGELQPHARTGLYLGVGAGYGNAGANVTLVDELDRESGGTASFRIGWMVREDLAVGVESTLWTRPGKGDVATELSWTFSVTTLAATYFPGRGGAYVRCGVGVGTTSVELIISDEILASNVETGMGIAAAAGYEWRVTKHFALAPQFEFAYLEINDEITNNVDFFTLTVQGTWYW